MKRSIKYMLQYPADPAQTADMSQMAEEVHKAENEKSAMAPAVDPEEHGVTGPEEDDPGKAEGAVGGQAEREKAAEAPASTDEPAKEEAPAEEFEEFEITLSEDSPLSQEQFDGLMDIVEKAGMSEVEAKSFIETQAGLVTMGADRVNQERTAQALANKKALTEDPLFEGNFEGALEVMKPAVQMFGDQDFNELLTSEIGNHPALGRFIYKIGKAMESEGFKGKGGMPEAPKKTVGQILYPSLFEKS